MAGKRKLSNSDKVRRLEIISLIDRTRKAEKKSEICKQQIEEMKCCGNCEYRKVQYLECRRITGTICDDWKMKRGSK